MKISFTALLTTVATVGALAVVQPASAAVNLSINSASYTYASFDSSAVLSPITSCPLAAMA